MADGNSIYAADEMTPLLASPTAGSQAFPRTHRESDAPIAATWATFISGKDSEKRNDSACSPETILEDDGSESHVVPSPQDTESGMSSPLSSGSSSSPSSQIGFRADEADEDASTRSVFSMTSEADTGSLDCDDDGADDDEQHYAVEDIERRSPPASLLVRAMYWSRRTLQSIEDKKYWVLCFLSLVVFLVWFTRLVQLEQRCPRGTKFADKCRG